MAAAASLVELLRAKDEAIAEARLYLSELEEQRAALRLRLGKLQELSVSQIKATLVPKLAQGRAGLFYYHHHSPSFLPDRPPQPPAA